MVSAQPFLPLCAALIMLCAVTVVGRSSLRTGSRSRRGMSYTLYARLGKGLFTSRREGFFSETGLPLETVWKVETVTILESHEWADRDQQALFGHLMLPETTFNKPSSYFPDSLSRKLGEQSRLHTPGTVLVCGRLWAYRGVLRVEAHTPCNALG